MCLWTDSCGIFGPPAIGHGNYPSAPPWCGFDVFSPASQYQGATEVLGNDKLQSTFPSWHHQDFKTTHRRFEGKTQKFRVVGRHVLCLSLHLNRPGLRLYSGTSILVGGDLPGSRRFLYTCLHCYPAKKQGFLETIGVLLTQTLTAGG